MFRNLNVGRLLYIRYADLVFVESILFAEFFFIINIALKSQTNNILCLKLCDAHWFHGVIAMTSHPSSLKHVQAEGMVSHIA